MRSLDTNISGGYQNQGITGGAKEGLSTGSNIDRMDPIEDESVLTECGDIQSRIKQPHHYQPPPPPPSGLRRARSTRSSNSRF